MAHVSTMLIPAICLSSVTPRGPNRLAKPSATVAARQGTFVLQPKGSYRGSDDEIFVEFLCNPKPYVVPE